MENSIQDRFFNFVDIIIRVPPLFVIDELLKIEFKLSQETVRSYAYKIFYLQNILKFLCCTLGCFAAICTFMLWTKHLIIVHLYLISMGAIILSNWSNTSTMKAIIVYVTTHESRTSILDDILSFDIDTILNEGPGFLMIQNYILQCILASIFCYTHQASKHPMLQKFLVLSFVAPSFLSIYPLPTQVLNYAPVFAALLPMAVCNFVFWSNGVSILKTIYMVCQHAHTFIDDYGLSALAETEWIRLNVPCVLRTFWLLRAGRQVIQILANEYNEESFTYFMMIKSLLVNGCDTLTALLGMTSIISYISYYIGRFFQWVLLTEDEGENSIGTASAILFYMLALQTGLTSLDEESRLTRLCRNLSLLMIAILHFVHNIVNPLLMSLSASRNPALHRHIRALAVCAFLILFPISLLIYLWSNYTLCTWLLAATIFNIEVVVKMLVSLAIYSLFLVDAYRSAFWEQLDDFVYIIRSFGNTVEFAFGIILFFNGFWILVFESGGGIRAIMMCIHAYLNIWCEAKAGWRVFMKRRTAVNKINSLPEAKAEQLRRLDDVCAICYQELHSAKITRCNHFFHGDCLRKWLYVQDRCPLCHDILYKVENVQNKETAVQQMNESR
ncbi:TRC8 ring finger protein [Megalopta genalis]|uniref:TRC8 ring finger protein n=1 Tax=Megalopta genalis TaxID=115081 RepID=UPI001442F907|nr:protein TRC8 homolog [Megalopta genalis]